MTHTRTIRALLVLGLVVLATGCRKNSNPNAPDSGAPGVSGATITITSAGVNPKNVQIAVGQSVTFLNSDSRSHDMTSDPHPSHTQCPSLNAVGVLAPGQSKLTNAISAATSCGFHDHGDPDNANLKGTITIR